MRTTVEIVASGQDSGSGQNLSIEIKNSRNEYSRDQCQQIEELCLEEELVRILEAGQNCDVNLIIALVLSRQLGWPIDFINDETTISFVLVVPSTPFGSVAIAHANAGTMDKIKATTPAASHPPLRKPATISYDQMHKDMAEVTPEVMKEQPEAAPIKPISDHPECLLVSCSDLVPLFEKGLGFKCDESFLEESAINSVARAIRKNVPYRFIFVDLDDPTLLLGRFMTSIKRLLDESPNVAIDVYACASTSSERMLKKCKEVKVKFIAKPMTVEKVQHLVPLYKN